MKDLLTYLIVHGIKYLSWAMLPGSLYHHRGFQDYWESEGYVGGYARRGKTCGHPVGVVGGRWICRHDDRGWEKAPTGGNAGQQGMIGLSKVCQIFRAAHVDTVFLFCSHGFSP